MLIPTLREQHSLSRAILVLSLSALVFGAACRSSTESNEERSRALIVVNAPATGEVRRVLIGEGVKVETGAPIIEIAVRNEIASVVASPVESAEAQAVRNLKSSDAEIEAARAEVVRHQAEVQRLTPLVASGQASQAELDGQRALYDRAQQRLQKAQDAERNAQAGLLASRQPRKTQGSATSQSNIEQIVAARATSAGTVSVINARVGERVTAGQPLATIRSDQP